MDTDTSLRSTSTAIGRVPGSNGNNVVKSGNNLPSQPADPAIDAAKEVRKQQAAAVGKAASAEIKDIREAVRKINDELREKNRELEFSVDEGSGKTVVKVIHSESGEVIRQFPSEVVLNFASAFTEGSASLLEDFA